MYFWSPEYKYGRKIPSFGIQLQKWSRTFRPEVMKEELVELSRDRIETFLGICGRFL
jgi:hypothetical protein